MPCMFAGGYTTGRADVVGMLRQKARPYLFSNSLAPPVVGASLKVFDLLQQSTELRDKLERNTKLFRDSMTQVCCMGQRFLRWCQ